MQCGLCPQGCLWDNLTQRTDKITAQKGLFYISLAVGTFSPSCCKTMELLTCTRTQVWHVWSKQVLHKRIPHMDCFYMDLFLWDQPLLCNTTMSSPPPWPHCCRQGGAGSPHLLLSQATGCCMGCAPLRNGVGDFLSLQTFLYIWHISRCWTGMLKVSSGTSTMHCSKGVGIHPWGSLGLRPQY